MGGDIGPQPALSSPGQGPPLVRLEGVTKRFGSVVAVDDVSLTVQPREFFGLLGASGSGKSTLLRLLAGFERPDSGRIWIDGQEVTHLPPEARPINLMFQHYALFPHLSVADNIAYGLRRRGLPAADRATRVQAMLKLVQLEGLGGRRIGQLSGGQRQRVALARALVLEPKVLLLDEPLSALDRRLREDTQLELIRLQDRLGLTFVVVTHDQDEAMSLSDRLAVMARGRLVQTGTPASLYEHPANADIADFIGTVSLIPARVEGADAGGVHARAVAGALPLSLPAKAALAPGARVLLGLRPEKIRILPPDMPPPATNAVTGRVRDMAFFGDHWRVTVECPDGTVLRVFAANTGRGERPAAYDRPVTVCWEADALLIFLESAAA